MTENNHWVLQHGNQTIKKEVWRSVTVKKNRNRMIAWDLCVKRGLAIHLLIFQRGEAIAYLYFDKNEGRWIDLEVDMSRWEKMNLMYKWKGWCKLWEQSSSEEKTAYMRISTNE